jgi:hypothetical protein
MEARELLYAWILVPLSVFNMFITHTTKRFKFEYQPMVFSYCHSYFSYRMLLSSIVLAAQLHRILDACSLEITPHSTTCMSGG